jgi:hypothetical protein
MYPKSNNLNSNPNEIVYLYTNINNNIINNNNANPVTSNNTIPVVPNAARVGKKRKKNNDNQTPNKMRVLLPVSNSINNNLNNVNNNQFSLNNIVCLPNTNPIISRINDVNTFLNNAQGNVVNNHDYQPNENLGFNNLPTQRSALTRESINRNEIDLLDMQNLQYQHKINVLTLKIQELSKELKGLNNKYVETLNVWNYEKFNMNAQLEQANIYQNDNLKKANEIKKLTNKNNELLKKVKELNSQISKVIKEKQAIENKEKELCQINVLLQSEIEQLKFKQGNYEILDNDFDNEYIVETENFLQEPERLTDSVLQLENTKENFDKEKALFEEELKKIKIHSFDITLKFEDEIKLLAAKYNQLKDENNRLTDENANLVSKFEDFSHEMDAKITLIQENANHVIELDRKKNAEIINNLQLEINKSKNEIDLLQENHEKLFSDYFIIEIENDSLKESKHNLEENIELIKNSNEKILNEKKLIQAENETYKEQIITFEKDNNFLNNEINSLTTINKELFAEKNQLKIEHENSKEKLSDIQIDSLKDELIYAKNNEDKLKNENAAQLACIKQMQKDLEELYAKNKLICAEKHIDSSLFKTYQNENIKLKDENSKKANVIKSLTAEKVEIESKYSLTAIELENITKERDELKNFKAKIEHDLREKEKWVKHLVMNNPDFRNSALNFMKNNKDIRSTVPNYNPDNLTERFKYAPEQLQKYNSDMANKARNNENEQQPVNFSQPTNYVNRNINYTNYATNQHANNSNHPNINLNPGMPNAAIEEEVYALDYSEMETDFTSFEDLLNS